MAGISEVMDWMVIEGPACPDTLHGRQPDQCCTEIDKGFLGTDLMSKAKGLRHAAARSHLRNEAGR
jgi:hypothetical protein